MRWPYLAFILSLLASIVEVHAAPAGIRAKDLRVPGYREAAIHANGNQPIAPGHQADHLIELQQIAHVIRKHAPNMTKSQLQHGQCWDNLIYHINHPTNLQMVGSGANNAKSKIVTNLLRGSPKDVKFKKLANQKEPTRVHILGNRGSIITTAYNIDHTLREDCGIALQHGESVTDHANKMIHKARQL